ncbi:diguanylate phosphodiesterase, partial [Bifidobacterium longum]
IEDINQVALVNQLNIPFRQGYAYGHPENHNHPSNGWFAHRL